MESFFSFNFEIFAEVFTSILTKIRIFSEF